MHNFDAANGLGTLKRLDCSKPAFNADPPVAAMKADPSASETLGAVIAIAAP